MRRAVLALLFLLLAPAARAADVVLSVPLVAGYDLDSTSLIYCNSVGEGGAVLAAPRLMKEKVKTSGSSTTVTSNTASAGAFTLVAVGDLLWFPRTEAAQLANGAAVGAWRYVTARASADSITVDTAIDLSSGYGFGWRDVTCGTSATSGEVPVVGFDAINFVGQIDQISVTGGIDYVVECRAEGPAATWATIIGPTNKTATWAGGNVAYEPWAYCRIGWKIGSADDGSDTGANAEKVAAYFTGTKR